MKSTLLDWNWQLVQLLVPISNGRFNVFEGYRPNNGPFLFINGYLVTF